MSLIYFKILGVEAKGVDATNDFTTDAYEFLNSHDWSVSLNESGLVGGPPVYTVEVSNNKTKWYEWDVLSTNTLIEDSVDAPYMSYKYMRIVYTASGTSAGTVDVELDTLNNIPNKR
jgi:hypothetical protein